MPAARVVVECDVPDGFRVRQVAGMFDVPLAAKAREVFDVEVPGLDEDWRIGAIVGPSGSGKSTVARHVYGRAFWTGCDWPRDKAVVDAFGDVPIKRLTQTLTAVGFSSPPAWVKPYHVLSAGQRFRCDLARALLGGGDVVAFDEFTSVVDRTVAKVGSLAVAKSVRKGRVGVRRFVAVSCHYDILDWLGPDWVLDMATGRCQRGCLWRRSRIRLEVFRCGRSAWRLFAKHHYLSGALNPAAECYLGAWDGEPVAFVAVLPLYAATRWRVTRVVVLPDYQGCGIGTRVTTAVAGLCADRGRRMFLRTGHPGMIAALRGDANWRVAAVAKRGFVGADRAYGRRWRRRPARTSAGRSVVSFAYRPAA